MRTPEEIASYLAGKASADLFGFATDSLAPYLPFDLVRPFLKPGISAEQWKQEPLKREAILETVRYYMEFAWMKVLDHRGLSASRSVEKMGAWMWLLGDDELARMADDGPYAQYGAPVLKAISQKYGFPIPNDPRVDRMVAGQKCSENCDEGCGRPPSIT